MDPQNKQRRTDTNYDSDNEIRTHTQNWSHFPLVESGDEALIAKLSPFAIGKGSQARIQGRLRSIKLLRNRAFFVECETEK